MEGFSPKECVMCYHLHLLRGGNLEHVAELMAERSVQPVCLRQACDKKKVEEVLASSSFSRVQKIISGIK